VATAECCIAGRAGFRGQARVQGRWDAALFGEAQSRIIVSLPPARLPALRRLARREGVPVVRLGRVGGDRLTLPGLVDLAVAELEQAWKGGLR
jgi:phosphoribosylformylglycinamidine synthase